LEDSVVFADGGGVNFGGGQREIPIAGKGLRGGKRDPAIVDCRNGEADITAKDYDSKPDYVVLVVTLFTAAR
jgi:hypothetical protein